MPYTEVVQESGSGIKRYRGTSADTKPVEVVVEQDGVTTTIIPPGSIFTELDTGKTFFWDSESWHRQHQDVALLEALTHLGDTMRDALVELKRIKRGTSYLVDTDLDKERI